jgi:AcrR family transcriptional regulator
VTYGDAVTDRRREILDAALAIADEHGVDAVSMRAVAQRTGVTPMALYPHVGSKAALLDGLVELLLTELPRHDPAASWQDRLEASAYGLRAVAHRHPNVFGLLFARPSVTRDSVRALDEFYVALVDAGVPDSEVPRLERMLSTFVIGFALSEVNGRFGPGSLSPRQRRAQWAAGELPGHHRLARHLDGPVDWSAEFARDLDDLVVVIEHLIDPVRAGRPAG